MHRLSMYTFPNIDPTKQTRNFPTLQWRYIYYRDNHGMIIMKTQQTTGS